jgi:hypothetical protein
MLSFKINKIIKFDKEFLIAVDLEEGFTTCDNSSKDCKKHRRNPEGST